MIPLPPHPPRPRVSTAPPRATATHSPRPSAKSCASTASGSPHCCPEPPDTDFHSNAGVGDDTPIGRLAKFPKEDVARLGYDALMAGDDTVVGGDDLRKTVGRNRSTPEPVKPRHTPDSYGPTGKPSLRDLPVHPRSQPTTRAPAPTSLPPLDEPGSLSMQCCSARQPLVTVSVPRRFVKDRHSRLDAGGRSPWRGRRPRCR